MKAGRHFLQIPGPTNLPDRVLRAMDRPTIDHRGPEFTAMTLRIMEGLKVVFKTSGPVVIFPSSGSGAWEAALVNTLSPRERILMFETGEFATLWAGMARSIGLEVDWVDGDWRRGVDPEVVFERLNADRARAIKAVAVVHNETSTGVTSGIREIRNAIDRTAHPALILVDAISSLGSIDYCHDEWGVDVTVAGSQKGLMLPAGLSFNAISEKALAVSKEAKLPKSYWAWDRILKANESGLFPYTPPTNLLFGLEVAIKMLREEGFEQVFRRHGRLAEATRRAVGAWGLEIQCVNSSEYSNTLTALRLPEGQDADALRRLVLERFDMSLGAGLGKLKGKVFRIGHLGDLNELMVLGTLCGVEMGLAACGVSHRKGGVQAALNYLAEAPT